MSAKLGLACLVAMAYLAALAGCATAARATPVSLLTANVELASGAANARTLYAVEKLYLGQSGWLVASFSWDSEGGAGWHSYWWEVCKGDQCVKHGAKSKICFTSSPFMLWLPVNTFAYGLGDFQGRLYVDDALAATIPFTIARGVTR